MRVAIVFINTYNTDRALRMFTWEFWEDMALLKTGDEFIFLTDQQKAPNLSTKNIQILQQKKTGIKWMDKKRLSKALYVSQTDCCITINENGFTISHFQKKENKKTDRHAKRIDFITNAEEHTKKKEISLPVISTIKPACRTVITSLPWAETESIKTQYTGGRSFFLFIGNIGEQHHLVELLKAFSSFKKWQQSNMQLVIAGYTTAFTDRFEEKLETYKYKADIVLLKNAASTEIAKLLAVCYAVLYPVSGDVFPLAVLWAVQSGKAVIATDNYINRQITANAEWVDENNIAEGFAKAMILLYKDEKQLQSKVQQAVETSGNFNRSRMLTEVWNCIEK